MFASVCVTVLAVQFLIVRKLVNASMRIFFANLKFCNYSSELCFDVETNLKINTECFQK